MTLSITFINGKKEKEKEKKIDITIEYDNYQVDNVPREKKASTKHKSYTANLRVAMGLILKSMH